MSFSRAPLKRFNETVGCAPPPGSYDIKPGDLKGAASFDRSSRFKHPKDAGTAMQPPPSPSRDALSTPVRRAMSVDMLVDGSSARKEKTCMTADRKQQKFLEKEIRSLVQQRGEQDRQLQALREELKKVEAKLLAFVREKTGLTANVTTLERQRAELKKINDFLKNKISADASKKRINSLTMELMEARNHLDARSAELSVLRVNSEGQLKELDAELQAARNTATSLKERNTNLEDLHHILKSQNTDLETENARLSAVICELKEELKVVQGYLDAANDEIQDLRLQLREKMASGSQEKLKDLQAELEQRTTELQSIRDGLKQKEQELESSQKTLKVLEDEMIEANKKIYEAETTIQQQEVELLRLRDVLRRTENELDERVAHLEQRCVFSEEERSRVQEEGLRRVNQLKNELSSLSEARSEALRLQVKLKHANETLEKDLAKQKELVETLSALVQFERDQSEKQVKQLKDEMEEILGELTLMEEQDEWKQEAILTLKKQNEDLERQLSDSRSLLESHQLQTTESKETLLRAEDQMGQIKRDWEEAQTALEVVRLEKEKLTDELDQAKNHHAKIKEEKDALETRLQAELERAAEENSSLLSQLKERDESIHALEHHLSTAESDRSQLQSRLREAESDRSQLQSRLREAESDRSQLQSRLREAESDRSQLQSRLREAESDRSQLQSRLREAESDRSQLQSRLREAEGDGVRLQDQLGLTEEKARASREQVEVLSQEKVALQWQIEEQRRELDRLTAEVQENSTQNSEGEQWKSLYEELFAKVQPFQEQLNAFAAQRDALLNENGANQEELNRLADAYAHLLGHQNQKQKIKHVIKLKDENVALKQEVSKLRSQVSRQKCDLEQLKAKLPGAPRRRFDPAKAFQHNKENTPSGPGEGLAELGASSLNAALKEAN
ncbi:hyaluronan mediated motility receptor isoform X2 [Salarias fasciatus]|uniref:hyaluronan mediated motility receptor isoform X2 n=1 Tax=Salarias fasciatus TaxID=181472 RepID=UPI00117664AB|nr:hyaluronan mediated motility receptor-like isoform X2 [Salarias fasciatus]